MARKRLLSLPDWHHQVSLQRVDPARNCYRSYQLQLRKDLFGTWVLIRSWGRIGTPQREQREYFVFRFDARERAQRIVRRRLLHGYRVTDTM